jgi:hypothetical protein
MNQILKTVNQVNDTIDSSGFLDLKTYLNSIQGSSIKKWDNTKSYTKDEIVIYNDLFYQSVVANSTLGTFIISEWKSIGGSGSSFEVVSSLPSSNIDSSKIYILGDFSLNYYDSSWHKLGNNQISIGIIAPIDTTKLFLDITDKTKPVLKWFDSTTTSWMNVSSTQIQSDWTQTDNTKTDYVKNKPTNLLTANNIKQGTNVSLTTSGNDVTINVNGGNATSINGINVNDSNRTNGTGIFYNSSTGKYENATVNITGIVGSSQITTISDTIIPSGTEVVFNHPISTNIIPSIEEQIAGSSVTDTHVDFSDASKYSLQDSGKILVGNNKAQLDIYTKLLMHMDDSSFTDVCGHIVTNNGVVLSNSMGYFNGNGYFNIPTNTNFDLNNNNFEIRFKMNIPTIISSAVILSRGGWGFATPNKIGWSIRIASSTLEFLAIQTDGSSTGVLFSVNYTQKINTTVYISIIRVGNIMRFFENGVQIGSDIAFSINIPSTTSYGINIGADLLGVGKFTGYIGELQIIKGLSLHTSNYSNYNQVLSSPYITINTPTYLKTTGTSNYSLTTIDTITSLTIPVTLPSANTTCKILTSFDNGVNWLYRSSGAWYKYTGDLTVAWTSSNLNTDLQTYFANISLTTLTSELSSLGIVPISLDFAFQLLTASLSETPSVSAITMIYVNKAHNEFASYGNYSSSNVEFGVKRVSNSQLAIKNLQSTSKTIKVNVVTSV